MFCGSRHILFGGRGGKMALLLVKEFTHMSESAFTHMSDDTVCVCKCVSERDREMSSGVIVCVCVCVGCYLSLILWDCHTENPKL